MSYNNNNNNNIKHIQIYIQQTEQSTIENVRWELRSEISKMATAQNEVNRLLQSVGDTSMIHEKLKKIHSTISIHKRKVSALEQSLNIDEFKMMEFDSSFNEEQEDINSDSDNDENNMKNLLLMFNQTSLKTEDEMKDFETMSKEYSKLKLKLLEYQQEEKEWNEKKKELEIVNKRCNNLMNMLEKLSDDKLAMTLHIEDLQALLRKHAINFSEL